MVLRKVELKPAYDSEEDDILNSFYIPALSQSIMYRRLAGFFSSTALAVAARGIASLVSNNGRMQLVAGAKLRRIDVAAINQGLKNPEEVISSLMIDDLDSIEDELIRDNVRALAWMVANKRLEIKVAIVLDKGGSVLDEETISKRGIFHQKVGIFEDSERNIVSFSGSVNETASAWKENIEEFKVFRSWENGEAQHLRADYKKFEKYWHGKTRHVKILDIPQAVRQKLLKIAPKHFDELKTKLEKWDREKGKTVFKLIVKPWSHQEKAINELENNSYRGIFKMATGTGKTYTALFCLERYFRDIKKYRNRILIIVPQHNLVEQWTKDLCKFTLTDDFVLAYDSKTPQKERVYARKIWKFKFNKDNERNIYLVITVDSIKNFKPFKVYSPDFIIGDEVHSYGTENRIRTLKEHLGNVKYRLGLSATPERYYDPDGTARILNYFGQIIYEYGIKDAQKDGILSKYNYHLFLVGLTPQEEKEIRDLTKKIGKDIAIDFKNQLAERENFLPSSVKKWMMQRAKKIKKAENKLDALREILEKTKGKLKQCIVYCEDNEQLDAVQRVFDDLEIDSYVKYHSGILKRQEALNLFKKKNCNFILSMHCLDQGVNIPSCESLILLSSSGNPREYIQRRGRVLRNPPDRIKPVVKIFDILAFPQNLEEMYRGLVMTQLVRAWEFIRCSQSPEEKMKVGEIMNAYGIYSEELDKIISDW